MIIAAVSEKKVSIDVLTITCGHKVTKAWWDQPSGMFIVLMDCYENLEEKRFRNLVAYDATNHLVWKAELPRGSGADCYVDAEIFDSKLFASSFSAYRCLIDVATGKVVECDLTK